MRVPLAARGDCVLLLLADHNVAKKNDDTSPRELHRFPLQSFLSKQKHWT